PDDDGRGNVVFRRPSIGEHAPLREQRLDQRGRARSRRPRQHRVDVTLAELAAVRVARFRQTIGVKEESLATFERGRYLLPIHPALDAERIGAAAEAVDDFAVAIDFEELRMARERR